MKKFLLILSVVAVFAAQAFAADWELDKAHSSVNFAVKHMMVSTVRGGFKDFDGTASFDPADLSTLSASFTAQSGSISTDNEKRDGHLKSADFFDTEKYPTVTFVSKKAVQTAPGKAHLTGDLTLRGVTKEVTFNVEGFNQEWATPWGGKSIGGVATTTINRQDFGVSWNKDLDQGGLVVGNNVDIEVQLEFGPKQ
ncbi:YceI family protein [bacterium]|nr:YceI family protein [bacterium]